MIVFPSTGDLVVLLASWIMLSDTMPKVPGILLLLKLVPRLKVKNRVHSSSGLFC